MALTRLLLAPMLAIPVLAQQAAAPAAQPVDPHAGEGSYLLNVGPDSHGVTMALEGERLMDIARWMRVNGDTIYGTKASHLDPVATGIVLRLTGAPVVMEPEALVAPQADGTYVLRAVDAILDGSTSQMEGGGADSGVTGTVAKTTGWSDYQTVTLDGRMTLSHGAHVIRIVAVPKPQFAVMNLRRIVLKASTP